MSYLVQLGGKSFVSLSVSQDWNIQYSLKLTSSYDREDIFLVETTFRYHETHRRLKKIPTQSQIQIWRDRSTRQKMYLIMMITE